MKKEKNIQKAIDGDSVDNKKRLTNFLLTCEQYLKKEWWRPRHLSLTLD